MGEPRRERQEVAPGSRYTHFASHPMPNPTDTSANHTSSAFGGNAVHTEDYSGTGWSAIERTASEQPGRAGGGFLTTHKRKIGVIWAKKVHSSQWEQHERRQERMWWFPVTENDRVSESYEEWQRSVQMREPETR